MSDTVARALGISDSENGTLAADETHTLPRQAAEIEADGYSCFATLGWLFSALPLGGEALGVPPTNPWGEGSRTPSPCSACSVSGQPSSTRVSQICFS